MFHVIPLLFFAADLFIFWFLGNFINSFFRLLRAGPSHLLAMSSYGEWLCSRYFGNEIEHSLFFMMPECFCKSFPSKLPVYRYPKKRGNQDSRIRVPARIKRVERMNESKSISRLKKDTETRHKMKKELIYSCFLLLFVSLATNSKNKNGFRS